MALTPIKNTLINLNDVFVNTHDGERYVTDRFSAWRLDGLRRVSKLPEVLDVVADGCYSLSAGGAVKPNAMYTQVPNIVRLFPTEYGEPLTRLPFVFDWKNDGARLWHDGKGSLIALDARFALGAFEIRGHVSGSHNKPVTVHRGKDMIGMVMPIRSADARFALTELASVLGIFAQEVSQAS